MEVTGDASAPRSSWTRQICWSPRGSWLVVHGIVPEIMLFRIGPQGIDRRLTLCGHAKPVEFVHFTPDESRLITACSDQEDRRVRVWDLSASNPPEAVRLLPSLDSRIRDVILTTDGRWLVAGDDFRTLSFTPAPFDGCGAIKVQGKGIGCRQIAFNPSGEFLLVGWSERPRPATTAYRPGEPFSVPGVDVFNMQDPSKRLESVPLMFPQEANEEAALKIAIQAIAIAPGGERLVVGLANGKAYLWDRADVTGRPLKTDEEEPVDLLEFSGEDRWLALGSTSARRIRLFLTQRGSREILPLSPIEDHEVNLRGFKFRRSNLDLISMDEKGVVRAADLRSGNPRLSPARLGVGGVKGIAAARDLDCFAIWSSDHRLRVWPRADDRSTLEELRDVVPPDDEKSEIACMAWSKSDKRLALALATSDVINGPRVQVWLVPKDGIPPSRIAQRDYLMKEGRFEPRLCLSEDGARLAVVLDDRVEVLDATHALDLIKIHRLTGVDDVAFLVLGGHRRLLIAAREGTLLIDPDKGERFALPWDGPPLSWHWAAPGGVPTFAVTREAVPRLVRWDADGAGGIHETASVPVSGETWPLALSGDTRWLAVAMLDEKVPIVRLLDAARLERARLEVDEDRKPREAVTFAAFLDDAPTLLIGTSGGHFRIWGATKGYADGVTLEPDEGGDFQQAFYSRTLKLLIVHRREAVELWDFEPGAADRVARRAAGRNFSREEWRGSALSTLPFSPWTFRDLPAMNNP